MSWDRPQAIEWIQELSTSMLKSGWCVGMLGSVLTRGYSDKDLDIALIPLGSGVSNIRLAKAALRSYGMIKQYSRKQVRKMWKRMGSEDCKHVEIWQTRDGRRVDVFFLS